MNYNPEIEKGANGRIDPSLRLACALRVFAGGDPVDITLSLGMPKTAVHDSVTYIIGSILKSDKLQIAFPTNHDDQKKIAEEFDQNSQANFTNCVGAIDGMLIWMEKPSEKDCKKVGVGSKKFY